MGHTKRSPEFKSKIEQIVKTLYDRCPEGGGVAFSDALDDAITLLENNTTDSPCIVKAKEDEPIFVLRGQDMASPTGLEAWIHKVKWGYEYPTSAPVEKIKDAEECLREMGRYPIKKLPD